MSETQSAPPAPFTAPTGAKDTGRFAAYDTTLGKYVGGTHDSRDKARKSGRDAGAKTVEIVEV